MTTRTWNGANDSFNNAADWSPAGVPTSGDTAIINAGTLASPMVSNASYNPNALTLSIGGMATLAGTGTFSSSNIVLSIAPGVTLVNSGTVNFVASFVTASGGGTLENDGTVALTNPSATATATVLKDAVSGTGQFTLGQNAALELGASVGSGQAIVMTGGASGSETLQLDAVASFGATISGFSATDLIAVINTPYTAATYSSTSANAGTLNLYSGTTLEGSIAFSGAYRLGDFTFKFNDFGNGQSNLQIGTTGPSGSPGGGGGTMVGAVYRFFDTKYGTHFFTSDIGERNTVLATRPDLTEETNGFGDVAQNDPNAVAVYRFFDKNFGTHFFTASATERDTVIATRPDLQYEPTSTFYEHMTQQSGDVAVYRLFDKGTGTQFLTGDQGEYNGIVTAGASTYRADLRSEGVAFYAPAGTFK